MTGAREDSPLPYYAFKARAEGAVREAGLESHAILRPTLVFARGDVLLNNIAWLLRRLPVFVVPGTGAYRVQPVAAEDVAELRGRARPARGRRDGRRRRPDVLPFAALVRMRARGDPARGAGSSTRRRGWRSPSRAPRAHCAGDTLVTGDELAGVMAELLVSRGPAAGRRRLGDWLAAEGPALGRRSCPSATATGRRLRQADGNASPARRPPARPPRRRRGLARGGVAYSLAIGRRPRISRIPRLRRLFIVTNPPFQRFLDAHREDVWRFLVAAVGRDAADDCFQETFMAAMRAYPQTADREPARLGADDRAPQGARPPPRPGAPARPVGAVPDVPGAARPRAARRRRLGARAPTSRPSSARRCCCASRRPVAPRGRGGAGTARRRPRAARRTRGSRRLREELAA